MVDTSGQKMFLVKNEKINCDRYRKKIFLLYKKQFYHSPKFHLLFSLRFFLTLKIQKHRQTLNKLKSISSIVIKTEQIIERYIETIKSESYR